MRRELIILMLVMFIRVMTADAASGLYKTLDSQCEYISQNVVICSKKADYIYSLDDARWLEANDLHKLMKRAYYTDNQIIDKIYKTFR